MLEIVQVGMNTTDLAGSLQLYAQAFGFQNAGGNAMWGDTMKVQGLAPDGRALIWWMVGRQPFFQLEFFYHTKPALRPLPAGWRPCDHGWVRFGIRVPHFDGSLAALATRGIKPCGEMSEMEGRRRFAFIDPFVGAVVEIIEDVGSNASGPAFAYATSSVSDLDLARAYYGDTLGLQIVSLDELHTPEHEALWGLAGARREGFLVQANDRFLEIVRYDNPVGRPRPHDYRTSDQGIVNVAFGSRSRAVIAATIGRLRAAGNEPPCIFDSGGILAAYINDPEREIELTATPEGFEGEVGFLPVKPFLG
jgi:catechol 2,3-dioxygenase-like lactoylglutathione lyase family enzyme